MADFEIQVHRSLSKGCGTMFDGRFFVKYSILPIEVLFAMVHECVENVHRSIPNDYRAKLVAQ